MDTEIFYDAIDSEEGDLIFSYSEDEMNENQMLEYVQKCVDDVPVPSCFDLYRVWREHLGDKGWRYVTDELIGSFDNYDKIA